MISRSRIPFLAGILISSCATTTSVTGNWEPDWKQSGPFERVLIVGIADNPGGRLEFETALRTALAGSGSTMWTSTALMPPGTPVNEDTIRELAEQQQADAVIVTSVESQEVIPKEVAGRVEIDSRQQTTNLADFFQTEYSEREVPGYLTVEYTAVLSTDVYETKGGQLVYNIESSAIKRDSIFTIVNELSAAIAARLRRDGVLK